MRFGYFICAICGVLSLSAQTDSLTKNRHVSSSTLIGAGSINVFDTYLSPLEYRGTELRIAHENIRRTHLIDGKVLRQYFYQVQLALTENRSATANTYYGMLNWNYALLYQALKTSRFSIFAGPQIALNFGGIYNTRNSNNPAQLYAYAHLNLSGLATYRFNLKQTEFMVRYQVSIPFSGIRFSPNYGESYYEIFGIKNDRNHIVYTSFHNAPSIQQILTLDFPLMRWHMRVGYICDIQQSKINQIKTHAYSHTFMVGLVKNFYLFDKKKAFHSFPLY